MTKRVVYRKAAVAEFEDAAKWYEERRRGLGEEFVIEIEQALEGVSQAPQRYPIVFGDVRRAVTRRFPYSIYFRLRGDTMVVLAIFHGRRNPLIWQRRG